MPPASAGFVCMHSLVMTALSQCTQGTEHHCILDLKTQAGTYIKVTTGLLCIV